MSDVYTPEHKRKYTVKCSNCGRPAAPSGCKEALCSRCVQEVNMGAKVLVYADPKTGSTIIEPGYLPGQTERIVSTPVRKGKPEEEAFEIEVMNSTPEETPRRIPRPTPERIPRRVPRSTETEKAFEEKAGLVEEELGELGGN